MEAHVILARRKLYLILTLCVILIITDFIVPVHAKQRAPLAMITKLLPVIRQQNDTLWRQRGHILKLRAQAINEQPLTADDIKWLKDIIAEFHIQPKNLDNKTTWQIMLRRVDIVPTSLALAQAAHESAWGTSRFAKYGNNYFGQWCFTDGCGMIPKQRPTGRRYEAQYFQSISDAIASYMHNLNTNGAYQTFRNLRFDLRVQKIPVTGLSVINGIKNYNPSRNKYVTIIRNYINKYQLTQYDRHQMPLLS